MNEIVLKSISFMDIWWIVHYSTKSSVLSECLWCFVWWSDNVTVSGWDKLIYSLIWSLLMVSVYAFNNVSLFYLRTKCKVLKGSSSWNFVFYTYTYFTSQEFKDSLLSYDSLLNRRHNFNSSKRHQVEFTLTQKC